MFPLKNLNHPFLKYLFRLLIDTSYCLGLFSVQGVDRNFMIKLWSAQKDKLYSNAQGKNIAPNPKTKILFNCSFRWNSIHAT